MMCVILPHHLWLAQTLLCLHPTGTCYYSRCTQYAVAFLVCCAPLTWWIHADMVESLAQPLLISVHTWSTELRFSTCPACWANSCCSHHTILTGALTVKLTGVGSLSPAHFLLSTPSQNQSSPQDWTEWWWELGFPITCNWAQSHK